MKARFLSNAEIERIFLYLSAEDKLLFGIARATGLRIGDVAKIRKKELRRLAPELCEISYVAEKTGKLGRTEIAGDLAVELLAAAKGKRGFVFASKRHSKSGHVTRQALWARFKKAAEIAGVPLDGCSPHGLRKAFAVALRHEKGLKAAQEALQHTNSAVTAIYAYADAYEGCDPDAPITWAQIGMVVDLVVEQLKAKKSP